MNLMVISHLNDYFEKNDEPILKESIKKVKNNKNDFYFNDMLYILFFIRYIVGLLLIEKHQYFDNLSKKTNKSLRNCQ